jgi:sec-independent protein translocase protein TatA
MQLPLSNAPAVRRLRGFMGELLTPTHLLVIAVVAFVLFGGKRLPELGKGIGEGLRGFRDGIRGIAAATDESASVARPDGASKLTLVD